jgi:hypothetical protein
MLCQLKGKDRPGLYQVSLIAYICLVGLSDLLLYCLLLKVNPAIAALPGPQGGFFRENLRVYSCFHMRVF